MTLKEMNDKVAKACDDIQAIAARVKAANRDYTEDEAKQIDSIQAQMDLDIVQLKALRAEENALAKVAGLVGAKAVMEKMREAGIGGEGTKSKEMFSHHGVKAHFLGASDKVAALDGGQRIANGAGEMIRAMICGVGRRTPHEVKAAMTGNNNSLGGILVPNYLSGDVIDLMRARAVLGAAGCPTIVLSHPITRLLKLLVKSLFKPKLSWTRSHLPTSNLLLSVCSLTRLAVLSSHRVNLLRTPQTSFKSLKIRLQRHWRKLSTTTVSMVSAVAHLV